MLRLFEHKADCPRHIRRLRHPLDPEHVAGVLREMILQMRLDQARLNCEMRTPVPATCIRKSSVNASMANFVPA